MGYVSPLVYPARSKIVYRGPEKGPESADPGTPVSTLKVVRGIGIQEIMTLVTMSTGIAKLDPTF